MIIVFSYWSPWIIAIWGFIILIDTFAIASFALVAKIKMQSDTAATIAKVEIMRMGYSASPCLW